MKIPGSTKNLLFLIAVLPICAFGQKVLTLNECLNLAFKHSHILEISGLEIQKAELAINESKAQRFPAVNLNAAYTRVGEVTTFTIPMGQEERTFRFGTQNRVNVNAQLNLPLFTWGRISNSVEISRQGKKLTEQEKQQKRVELTDQVLRAYYSVLLNMQLESIQIENTERAKRLVEFTENRMKAGGVPDLELLRTRVQQKNSLSSLSDIRSNLEKSKLFLKKVLGFMNQEIKVAGHLSYQPVSIEEDEILKQALAGRSEFNILRIRKEMAMHQAALTNSGNKPSLIFFSGYNVQNGFDPTNPDRFVDNWNAGLQINFPVFDGFATKHRVQQAKIERRQLDLQEIELQEMLTLQVRQATITLRQAETKISSQMENIELAKKSLESAETQYRNGLVSSLDVLNAQDVLAKNETAYIQAIFNHIMAKLELSKTMEDYSWFYSDLETGDIH